MPDLGGLLNGLNIMGIIFGLISELTFLLDIFIVSGLVAALLRGIFKKFWKVMWKNTLLLIMLGLLLALAPTIAPFLKPIPLSLSAVIGGETHSFANLGEVLYGLIELGTGDATFAAQMGDVILVNLTIIIGVPLVLLVVSILSLLTFPLFQLLISKKLREFRGLPIKLVISLVMFVVVTLAFALPFTNIVPAMSAFKASIDPDSLLGALFSEELIGVFELFTSTKSVGLRILNPGGFLDSLAFYGKVGTTPLFEAITSVFEGLNVILPDPVTP